MCQYCENIQTALLTFYSRRSSLLTFSKKHMITFFATSKRLRRIRFLQLCCVSKRDSLWLIYSSKNDCVRGFCNIVFVCVHLWTSVTVTCITQGSFPPPFKGQGMYDYSVSTKIETFVYVCVCLCLMPTSPSIIRNLPERFFQGGTSDLTVRILISVKIHSKHKYCANQF